ncbi:MAG: hypothetical protein ACRDHM_00575 [Actinomycetota bacterium]
MAREALYALRSGWGRVAIVAAGTLAIAYVLSLLLAWLRSEATPQLLPVDGGAIANPIASIGVAKEALLSLMLFHGVSLGADIALPPGAVPFGASFEVSASLTLMLGLAVAGYLLFRGGKWAAAGSYPEGWLRAARGLQIAFVYAALALVLGLLASTEISFASLIPAGEGPESVTVAPSIVGAFGMPFVIAALAAGAGALSGRLWPRERPARLALGGMAGGWRAAWLATALASIGFLIVAALNPDETRAYLEILPGGGLSRALMVVATLLVLPNVGTGIAAAAMGGSINIATAAQSCVLISFLKFPAGVAQLGAPGTPPPQTPCVLPIELDAAPWPYLLFLLVPLVATIAGGRLSAQRSGATEAGEGAIAGAAIAIPYALWLWLFALVARVGAESSFFAFQSSGWIGPGLLWTVLLALVWGVLGGAIGGALGARNADGPGKNPGPSTNDSA